MAVKLESTIKRWLGLSTDAKPYLGLQADGTTTLVANDIPVGSSFLETDTGRIYRWNGTAWTYPGEAGGAIVDDEVLGTSETNATQAIASTLVSELEDLKDYLLDLARGAPRDAQASEAHVGQVGGYETKVQGVLPGGGVIPAAGNYAANDVISDSTSAGSPWYFPGCARQQGGGGHVMRVKADCSSAAIVARLRLYLFHTAPITSALIDNTAFDLKAADRKKLVGWIDLPAMADIGDVCAAQNAADRLQFSCASDSRDLWGILVFLDAETNETAAMTVTLELGITQTT